MKRTRLYSVGKVRRRRGSSQKEAMKEFLRGAGRACWHCGWTVRPLRVHNAAHIRPKGKYPELACDPDNFYLLCSSINHPGGMRGCHEVYDGGSLEEWEKRRNKYRYMGRELEHRSELPYIPVTKNE